MENLLISGAVPLRMKSMITAIELLLALQSRDQTLSQLRADLKAVPLEVEAKRKLVRDSEARLESSKARSKAIEVEKKSLQVEAAAKRDLISKYRGQQLQTRKNEEYTALAHEIENAEKAIVSLEDREIALMEELDTLQPAIEEATRVHTAEKNRIDAHLATLAEKESNLQRRISEVEELRAKATRGIDEDVLDQYDRLFETKNARAVVSLEHDTCTGCHMKVTAQTALAVRSEKTIVSCPHCGRLLHLPA